jgi:hypothetical protein
MTIKDIEFRWLVGNEERVLQFRYLIRCSNDTWEWTPWITVKEVYI